MPKLLILFLSFYAGAIVGSFLNVVIYRVPRNISIRKPRSFCPHCQHPIRFYDNLPIFSYLILRGHCRYCLSRISPRYLWVELTSGLVWLLVIAIPGLNVTTIGGIILLEGLLCLAWIDYRWGYIPDNILLTLAFSGSLFYLLFDQQQFLWGVSGALVAGSIMLGWAYLGKEMFHQTAIGGGDIKLASVIGLFLGTRITLLCLFLSFCLGGIYGLTQIYRKRLQPKATLPLAPFIFIAAWLSILVGEQFVSWYLSLAGGH